MTIRRRCYISNLRARQRSEAKAAAPGNPDEPEYSFQSLDDDGKIEMIPLPDPLTMVYPGA